MKKQNNRRLLWDACYNVRDLGGYSTIKNKQTRWRAFVRADHLARLTPEGKEALISYGVETIIDLRSDYELDIDPPPFTTMDGQNSFLQYENLPVLDESDKDGMAILNRSQSLSEMYCWMLDRFKRNIMRIMNAFVIATKGTTLFHCHSGRDRTGLIAGILLALAGVDYPTIAKDYAISSVYIQPKFEQNLTEQPEIMLHLLAYLDKEYGGAKAYLVKSGMPERNLAHLCSHLVV